MFLLPQGVALSYALLPFQNEKFFFVLYCVRFALTLQRIAPYLIINIWYNYYTTIVNNYTLYTI